MENVSVRELALCEFNRILPIISEVIVFEREIKKLAEQQKQLQEEINQKKKIPEILDETLEEKREKVQEILKRKRELCEYKEKLKELVSNALCFAFDDEILFIQKDEINRDYSKEYIYLLTNIPFPNGEYLEVDRLFAERAELILLLYEKYGRQQEKLIYAIANLERDSTLDGFFTDYFEL